MQMRKKILAVALAATMVFGLVGCGSSSQSSDKTTKANNEILASMDSTLGQIADCLSTGENNETAE